MNAKRNAVRTGARRGWTEFGQSLRSPQDQGFYLFTAVVVFGYLFLRRNSEVEGTDLPFATVAMPSILGGLLAFGMIIGPMYALAMEREDGSLLRAKAVPHGMLGHLTGHLVSNTAAMLPSLGIILVPGVLFIDDLMSNGLAGWWTVAWVAVLGIGATLPIGLVIGALVPGVQKAGTWGMLPFLVLTGISGVVFPIESLWGWLQPVGQAFPLYWLGHGMRAAFLPESAAVAELGGEWRLGMAAAVLTAWTVAGLVVAPRVLGRMSRRQSGSQVEAAREQALQWVR